MSSPPPPPTDDEILQRLATDPRYWIERSLFIVDQYQRRVPFLFNEPQAQFYAARSELDIVVKSRKMGFSSAILAIILYQCAFVPHTRAAIISHDEDATVKLLRRVKDYIKSSLIPIRTAKDTETALSFPDTDGWLYVGTAGSRSFGRGDDLTIVHLSESAHYQDRKIITGVQEALIKGAKTWIVQETTANGAGTPFHESWLRAIRGESEWKAHFWAWWQDRMNQVADATPFEMDDEERALKEILSLTWEQLAWRRQKLRTMDQPELFAQEYPASWEEAFLASGAMIFDWRAIKRQEEARRGAKWQGHIIEAGRSIAIEPDPKGPLTVWLSPDERARYLIVCDAGDGVVGGAYSVADAFDVRTWEQVAQFRGHPDPIAFADIVMRLGVFYGHAHLACENNYPGNAVIARWVAAGYPNIYDDPDEAGDKLGWVTTVQSRPAFIADGRAAIKDGSLKINAAATLNEYRTFVLDESGKMTHQAGCWSDTVITSCKAANILKRWVAEPETQRPTFREAMGFKRRRGGSSAGGEYQARVV